MCKWTCGFLLQLPGSAGCEAHRREAGEGTGPGLGLISRLELLGGDHQLSVYTGVHLPRM